MQSSTSRTRHTRGCTSMHFGENQLSPRSVGISPLSTAPPPVLQHWWVRASTNCYIRFTLAMDGSRGFGSHRRYICLFAPFSLGFPQAPALCRSLTRNVDALAGSFYKRHAISPCLLVQEWPLTAGEYVVSGSLSSPSRGAFHLSLTVLVHYRSLLVLSLGGWSPQLPTRFLVSRGTQDTHRNASSCLTGLSPALVVLSSTFRSSIHSCCGSYNPTRSNDQMVWAPPVSLATTPGISIDFFSSGY